MEIACPFELRQRFEQFFLTFSLFSRFIADLSKILQETGCHVVFYADDLVFSPPQSEKR